MSSILPFAKKGCLILPFLMVLTYLIYFYFTSICTNSPVIIRENFNLQDFKRNNDTKYILYWTPFWGFWHYFMGFGFEPFKNCEYQNCYTTKDRNLIPIQEIDAILFHAHAYSKKKHGLPEVRLPHQMYIYMNIEAPINNCPDVKQYASLFNWTMSYRFDSDIVRRHGFFFQEETGYIMHSKESLRNKTKLAAWLVSNCRARSRREELGKEIQKFMSVDVYGNCGNLTCARKKGDPKISAVECYDMIEKNYKFYFSWENSYCKDYASEKLYNVLVKDIVPVVYGAGDYKLATPPNSVINVEDFESASKLADYLKYLDKNDDEYLKYFEWKKHYRPTSRPIGACELCKKLHKPIKHSIYHDLHEWWWGKNKSMCKKDKDLPKIVSNLFSNIK